MPASGRTFRVLDELGRAEAISQRELASRTGISLGQINYMVNQLVKKGLIKIRNFKNNPYKAGYTYILTPRGLEEKSRLAVRFVISKLNEYNLLKETMARRLKTLSACNANRILFVGPKIAEAFLQEVIHEAGCDMTIVHRYDTWRGLSSVDQPYDTVLLFDDSTDSFEEIQAATGVDRNRLVPMW